MKKVQTDVIVSQWVLWCTRKWTWSQLTILPGSLSARLEIAHFILFTNVQTVVTIRPIPDLTDKAKSSRDSV